ncbi:hypothetical protein LTR86_005015 [Recurvomyces mirabilis]|nr:hypothetical protein LTR86_005015 [Recurvomyces mirabilis]
MSNQRLARNLALGVVGGGALFYFFPRATAKVSPGNIFETPAVKSVADRHSAGGATTTSTPGVATERGNASQNMSKQINPKGVDTLHFKENQASQKVGEGPSAAFPPGAQEAFHKAQYGEINSKGK